MEAFAVVMAGGRGERFWPHSRDAHPKQFLNILGDETLLNRTVNRLLNRFAPDHIFIATSSKYISLTKKLLPQIPHQNLIGEVQSRNTAPCIALAAGLIKRRAKDSVIAVLPSDQWIDDEQAFLNDLDTVLRSAQESDGIITLGIKPDHPSSEYGYIEFAPSDKLIKPVKSFVEKPDKDLANKFIKSGNFLWNIGMFVMSQATLQRALEQCAPELMTLYTQSAKYLSPRPRLWEQFCRAPKISFDYAVMERYDTVQTLLASFVWDDVGNWSSLARHGQTDSQNNTIYGKAELLDCQDCVVFTDDEKPFLVAGIELNDLIIAKSGNAILITPKGKTGKIKKLLANCTQNNPEFL